MKHIILSFFTVLGVFTSESIFSQDVNRFSSDENKFFIGFQLSGAFPVESFTNLNIGSPCNSSINTGSVYELTLGYRINAHLGGALLLSEAPYELDPASVGAAQLISGHPGLYQSAAVFKSGQLIAQSAMIGAFYDLPISKNGKIFLKPKLLLGIIGCTIPEIEVVGQHSPGASDKSGNSIDTVETWDMPKIYAYSISYRIEAAMYYALNKRFDVFVNLAFQGSSLSFANVPFTYNLTVNSTNNNAGTSTALTNNSYVKEINPSVSYQAIIVGLGCEIRF
ncbi:MAG TPA: hypothetical protein VK808_11835 [Bacteroidia bacterium]|jgi:hypothetical protein|nr:hypothetical protein [Bacteroidia bacterium]